MLPLLVGILSDIASDRDEVLLERVVQFLP